MIRGKAMKFNVQIQDASQQNKKITVKVETYKEFLQWLELLKKMEDVVEVDFSQATEDLEV